MKKILLAPPLVINILLYLYSWIGVRLFPPFGIYLIIPISFTIVILLLYTSKHRLLNNFLFLLNLCFYFYTLIYYDLIEPPGIVVLFPIIFSSICVVYQTLSAFKSFKKTKYAKQILLVNTFITTIILYLVFQNLLVILVTQTINQIILNFYYILWKK